MAKKDSVNKVAIKEMFDFFLEAIINISDESPEFYQELNEEYDKKMDRILEA